MTFNVSYGWLSVHLSITLVEFQINAQNSYLFIYNTFIIVLYIFRPLPCLSSGGLCRKSIYSSSGIVTLCRRLYCEPVKKEEFFLNRCTGQSPAEIDNTRGCIYTIATLSFWRCAGWCPKHVEILINVLYINK
jgi:hypothetical protein